MPASDIRISSVTFTASLAKNRALWIVLFSLFAAIGAQFEIPVQPVPFTLQTFFVLLAGALLGPRSGFISMALYLAAGLLGAPVFAGFTAGIAKLIGPTGGYLLAFPIAAFVVGWGVQKYTTPLGITLSMIGGLLVIFSLGTLQLYATIPSSLPEAFKAGFLIFSWWDVLKLAGAASIASALLRRS